MQLAGVTAMAREDFLGLTLSYRKQLRQLQMENVTLTEKLENSKYVMAGMNFQ